jgi:hypothetical protein
MRAWQGICLKNFSSARQKNLLSGRLFETRNSLVPLFLLIGPKCCYEHVRRIDLWHLDISIGRYTGQPYTYRFERLHRRRRRQTLPMDHRRQNKLLPPSIYDSIRKHSQESGGLRCLYLRMETVSKRHRTMRRLVVGLCP